MKKKGYELGKQEHTTLVYMDLEKCESKKYHKVWNRMINIGPIWDLNKANVQFHIIQLNEQLHFKYIRVWNVFSKKIMINDGKTIGQ